MPYQRFSRRTVVRGGLGGTAALLAGCLGDGSSSGDGGSGTQTENGGSGAQGKTVRWLDHFGSEKPQFEQIISNFESANSNAQVELTQVSPSKYRQKFSTAVGTPNAPDVFHHWTGPGDLGKYVADDVILNLDDHFSDSYLESFAGLSACKYGSKNVLSWRSGNLRALPFNMFGLAYWYNKDVIADAGIEESEIKNRRDITWDEFLNICKKIKDSGTTPIVMGGSGNAANLGRWVGPALIKAAGVDKTLGAAWGKNDAKFTDDVFVEAMSRVQTLYDKGYVNDSVNAITRSQSVNMFGTDKGAFYFQGSWMPNQIQRMIGEDAQGLGEKYNYFWHPIFPDLYDNGQNELNVAVGSSRAINKPKTESRGNRDAAVGFLKEFYSKESQQLLMQEGGVPVARLDAWPSDLTTPQQIQQKLLTQGNEADATYPFFPTALLPKTKDAFLSGVQSLFTGKDPQKILQNVENARQEDLKEYQ
jgi:ABC-type glycerol-3-phosphate transport system substrate-binding protein